MNLMNFVFGGSPVPLCKWCKKPIGSVDHQPVPLCQACFTYARSHHSERYCCDSCSSAYRAEVERRWAPVRAELLTKAASREAFAARWATLSLPPDPYVHGCPHEPKHWPGDVCSRIYREFPAEEQRRVRRMMARPSAGDMQRNAAEATQDIMALQNEAFRLRRSGKKEDAARIESRAKEQARAVAQFKTETVFMLPTEDADE